MDARADRAGLLGGRPVVWWGTSPGRPPASRCWRGAPRNARARRGGCARSRWTPSCAPLDAGLCVGRPWLGWTPAPGPTHTYVVGRCCTWIEVGSGRPLPAIGGRPARGMGMVDGGSCPVCGETVMLPRHAIRHPDAPSYECWRQRRHRAKPEGAAWCSSLRGGGWCVAVRRVGSVCTAEGLPPRGWVLAPHDPQDHYHDDDDEDETQDADPRPECQYGHDVPPLPRGPAAERRRLRIRLRLANARGATVARETTVARLRALARALSGEQLHHVEQVVHPV